MSIGNVTGISALSNTDTIISNIVQLQDQVQELLNKPLSKPEILSSPQPFIVEEGKDITLNIDISGKKLSYQWQIKHNDIWENIDNAKSETLTLTSITPAMSGKQYRVGVTGGGQTIYSNAIVLSVQEISKPTFIITKQPENTTVAYGETASISVEVDGNDIRYQWQLQNIDTDIWEDLNDIVNGSNTNTLIFTATAESNGRKYRCILTDSNGTIITSSYCSITVTGFAIITQPTSVKAEYGDTIIFSTETFPKNIVYQWEVSEKGTNNWANVTTSEFDTNSLTIEANQENSNLQWRCHIKLLDSDENFYTDVVTIIQDGIMIMEQPRDIEGIKGDSYTLSIAVWGEDLTYQWQLYSDEEWNNYTQTTATDAIFIANPIEFDSFKVRCIISKGENILISNEAIVRMERAETKILTDLPEELIYGDDLVFSWKSAKDTGTVELIVNKYFANNSYSSRQYEGEIHPGICSIIIKTSTLEDNLKEIDFMIRDYTISPASYTSSRTCNIRKVHFEIVQQPLSIRAKYNNPIEFSVLSSIEDAKYQWQDALKGSTEEWHWDNITNATNEILSINASRDNANKQYRCKITEGTSEIYSDIVTIIQDGISVIEQPQSITSAINKPFTLSVSAWGENLNYQWQNNLGENSSWQNYSEESYDQPIFTSIVSDIGSFKIRCLISNNENFVISNEITATFVEPLAFTSYPSGQTITKFPTSLSVTANKPVTTYQWQKLNNSSNSWGNVPASSPVVDGGNTSTVTFKQALTGTYRCRIYDGIEWVDGDGFELTFS